MSKKVPPSRGGARNRPGSAIERPLRHLRDPQLIEACLDHDPGSWEELLRRFSDLIYSTILKVRLPQDEIEEVYQATVVAAYDQLAGLRHREKLSSWLIGIAYRQSINQIRRRGRVVTVDSVGDALISRSVAPPPADEPPDQTRLRLEQVHQVREALHRLPERCRRLLERLFLEEPTPEYEAIARSLGIPIGSIGPTRARCLEKLRRSLEEDGWPG